MSTTYLPPELFIEETKRWKVTSGALIRVRMMQKGNFIYCKLTIPNNSEELWTRVKKEDQVKLMDLKPISVPAVWSNDSEVLLEINQKIGELNATNITPNRNKSIWDK